MTRIGDSLAGKRVLITLASEFMGPVLCETFAAHGAVVIADQRAMDSGAAGEAAVRVVGHLGQAGEIVGALLVTAAVLAFVRWSRRRRMLKEARRQRVASMPPQPPAA